MRRIQIKNQLSVKQLFIDKGHLNKNHQFVSMNNTQTKFGQVLKESRTINQNPKSQMFLMSYLIMKGKENNPVLGIEYSDDDVLQFVLNIYKVLLTRGIKGTFVYVCDPDLREFLRVKFDRIA